MSLSQVVVPVNLGTTIKAHALATNKYDVNLDKDTLIADNAGVVKLNTSSQTVLDLIKAAETTTSLSYDATTKSLTYTNEDGVAAVIDLSALAIDVNLTSGSYDAATFVLTLTDTDGSTVTVSLGDLKKVVTAASTSISFTGTGESSSPLTADIKVSTTAGNALSVDSTGLFVPTTTFTDSTSIDFTVTGNDVTAKVIDSYITGLATVELVDAFSLIHVGYIFP